MIDYVTALHEWADALRRSERPNPSLIILNNGTDPSFVFRSTTRMRISTVEIAQWSNAFNSFYGIKIGSAVWPLTRLLNAVHVSLHFPMVIEPGDDVAPWDILAGTILDPARVMFYLFASPEVPRG